MPPRHAPRARLQPAPQPKGERTRAAIVAAGSRRFRDKGYAATSLRDIMGDCGLTMGGFYAHFSSKGELFASCFRQSALEGSKRVFAEQGAHDFMGAAMRYLSEEHLGDRAGGCPLAALLSELFAYRNENPGSELVDGYVQAFAKGLQDRGAEAGKTLGLLSLLLGAANLARSVQNQKLRRAIIEQSLGIAGYLRQTAPPKKPQRRKASRSQP